MGGHAQTTIVLLAGLQGIPSELYEAAAVDAAEPGRRFRYVTWPRCSGDGGDHVARPHLELQLLRHRVRADRGGPGGKTTMLPPLFAYNESFRYGNFGYAASMGNAMVLMVVGLFALVAWVRILTLTRRAPCPGRGADGRGRRGTCPGGASMIGSRRGPLATAGMYLLLLAFIAFLASRSCGCCPPRSKGPRSWCNSIRRSIPRAPTLDNYVTAFTSRAWCGGHQQLLVATATALLTVSWCCPARTPWSGSGPARQRGAIGLESW